MMTIPAHHPSHPEQFSLPAAQDDQEALLQSIETADLQQLRTLWKCHIGVPVPKLRSAEILRLMLGYRLQEEREGGLSVETCKQLKKKRALQAEGLGLGVGARLRRIWKGRQVEVIVEENGFRYEGQLYKSLSAAATAIAGSRWNGPRFFGLRPGSMKSEAHGLKPKASAEAE